MTSGTEKKILVAQAALAYVEENAILGVGTGSTVNYFIDALVRYKKNIRGAIASSEQTAHLLKEKNIPLLSLNSDEQPSIYIDGADAANRFGQLIKGGGGALTREKIIATASRKFVCIIDDQKLTDNLSKKFPLPIETIPMARNWVARQMIKMGGRPVYRINYLTDNGNSILDVHDLDITEPLALEQAIKCITGVVEVGLFAKKVADIMLIGESDSVKTIQIT